MWLVMCLLFGFDVNATFELVRAGPAAGALLFVGRGRPGAGDAADRAVAGLVQRVVRDLVDLDVGPDALLVPVGEGVELPDAVAVRPLQLRGRRPARRLVAADARDPGVVRTKRLEQWLDLADVATAVRVAFPEIRALALVLLRDRDYLRALEREPVPLDEPVARLIALAEEELRVQLDYWDVEPELRDHVHEHRRLLLPGARQAELVAELLVAPAKQVLRGHRLEIDLRDGSHEEGARGGTRGSPALSSTSFSVSPRRPSRSVSSGITSSGGMFPRLTFGPNSFTKQACDSFVGASKTRSETAISWTISSTRPVRISPVGR